jgi:hypothetical protein
MAVSIPRHDRLTLETKTRFVFITGISFMRKYQIYTYGKHVKYARRFTKQSAHVTSPWPLPLKYAIIFFNKYSIGVLDTQLKVLHCACSIYVKAEEKGC